MRSIQSPDAESVSNSGETSVLYEDLLEEERDDSVILHPHSTQ